MPRWKISSHRVQGKELCLCDLETTSEIGKEVWGDSFVVAHGASQVGGLSVWCCTGGGPRPRVRGVHGMQKRSLWESREQSDWKGWLGSKGSGGVVNRRPEECVQFADWGCPWEVFCHTEVFQKSGAIQKNLWSWNSLKKSDQAGLGSWVGDGWQPHPEAGGGGWTAIQVPLLSAALIHLISVSSSALQAFGFVTWVSKRLKGQGGNLGSP